MTEQQPVTAVPETFTLELTLEEMGFLRLLLTNATVQPAAAEEALRRGAGEDRGAHRAPAARLVLCSRLAHLGAHVRAERSA